MEFTNDLLGFFASVREASFYTKISIDDYIKMIEKGYFPIPEEKLGTIPEKDSEHYESFLDRKIIPISYFSEEANVKYLTHFLANDDITSIDFLAYRVKYGRKAEEEFIRQLCAFKEMILKLDSEYTEEPLTLTKDFCKANGLSMSKYYDYKNALSNLHGFSKILNIHKVNYTKTICAYARDLIFDRAFRKEKMTNDDILQDLVKIKGDNPDLCDRCPHNCSSQMHETAKNWIYEKASSFMLTECQRDKGNSIIIPESESTISRLLKNEGEQPIYLARNDRNQFLLKYGSKILRDRAQYTNEVFCADHSELDILVKIYIRSQNRYEIVRPWLTLIIDSCSNAIVESVISLRPTKYTIMECICRAMSVKPNSPFCGTFSVLYADNSSCFVSDYVSGKREEVHLNEILVDNPLLNLLSIRVRHARKKSPNSKPVERTFGTLKKYLCHQPGYIGNKRKRPISYFRLDKVKNKYLKHEKFWDYEKLVQYWFDYVVPHYNNTVGSDGLSPIERYMNSQKIKCIIPDWSSMSYFLVEKQKCTVRPQGIRYNHTVYDCSELKDYITPNKTKWIRVYDFDPPMSDSIILLYDNKETKETKFIGVAYKKVHTQENKPDLLAAKHEFAIQNWQYTRVNDTISATRYLTELNRLSARTYLDYDPYAKLVFANYYSDVVDETNSRMVQICNTETLKVVRAASVEKTKHIDAAIAYLEKKEEVVKLIKILKSYKESILTN